MLSYFLSFTAGLLIDVFYTLWVRFLERKRPHSAALCSSLIGVCAAVGVTQVSHTYAALPLYAAGLYAGTLLGYRLSK
jgi:hypothetical protein